MPYKTGFIRKHLHHGALFLLLLGVIFGFAHASGLLDKLGIGGDSGKLAKYEFQLKDSFPVTSLIWSPDGKYIVTSSIYGNALHIWDVEQRKLVKTILGARSAYVHSLAWSPNGQYLAACNVTIVEGKPRSYLRLIDTDTWQDAYRLDPNDKLSFCERMPAFSSDSKQVAVLGSRLVIYSTKDGHVIKISELMNGWARGKMINAIAYVPGTYSLLIGTAESDYRDGIKDLSHKRLVGRVWFLGAVETIPTRSTLAYPMSRIINGSSVIGLAVSPDGRQIATGTQTGAGLPGQFVTESVHIFQLPNGNLLGAPLDGLKASNTLPDFGAQYGLTYTLDGRYLIVGHGGIHTSHVVHLIDAHTFKVVDEVHVGGVIYDVAVHPKSTYFAATSNQKIIVWSLPAKR